MKNNSSIAAALLLAGLPLTLSSTANCQELITNGGFETGDFSGWTVKNLAGSDPSGTFAIGNNILDTYLTPVSPSTPIAELASPGASSGNYYAVSDSFGPGAHVLLQSFTVPLFSGSHTAVTFDMFTNDWNGYGPLNQTGSIDANQLDGLGNLIPTQFARVDILAAGADAFSVAPADVVASLYNGEDSGMPSNGYTHYTFDISHNVTAGSTYQLRFAEVDNQFTLNQGIDNVHVMMQTPEPGSAGLILGLCFAGTVMFGRKMRRKDTVLQTASIA